MVQRSTRDAQRGPAEPPFPMRYQHGSYAAYRIDRCRCERCRDAVRAYNRRRAADPTPVLVPAHPAVEHLQFLREHGIGLKTVARRTNLSHSTLAKIVYGTNQRPPSRMMKPSTLEKILAVRPDGEADGTRTPAAPVRRLVDELLARGWTKAAIARHVHGPGAKSLHLGREYVTRRNAAAVKKLYEHEVARSFEGGAANAVRQQRYAEYEQLCRELASVLELRATNAAWREKAACRGRPVWVFFPARGDRTGVAAATEICASCVVRSQCRQAHGAERDGVWGAQSAKQRRRERSTRRTYEIGVPATTKLLVGVVAELGWHRIGAVSGGDW